jgi:hypothetical protein
MRGTRRVWPMAERPARIPRGYETRPWGSFISLICEIRMATNCADFIPSDVE